MRTARSRFAGTTHVLDEPFCVLATQNPLEMEGTYPLPEAQLDRFLLKLHVSFPSHDELHRILDRTTGGAEPTVSSVLSREELLEVRATLREIAVARHVQDYAVRVLEATHRDASAEPLVKRTALGASQRRAGVFAGRQCARALCGSLHIGSRMSRGGAFGLAPPCDLELRRRSRGSRPTKC